MKIAFSSFQDYFTGFCPTMLLYSFNGSGKTTFCGMTGLRTVLLDCGDAGVVTLRRASPKNLKIIRIKSTDHYMDVIGEVVRLADKIDLLVIDTLTGLQSKAIREVKGRKGQMSIRKWGQVSGKMIECISETRNFPKDVIYLAQEKRRQVGDEDSAVIHYAPSLTPSVREAVSSAVDWVGRLYVEDGNHKLSFILTDETEAKDRADLFPLVISNLPKTAAYLKIRERIVSAIHG
jgi:phage nucleotide-binding protein